MSSQCDMSVDVTIRAVTLERQLLEQPVVVFPNHTIGTVAAATLVSESPAGAPSALWDVE